MDYRFCSQKGITKLESPYDVSNVLQCIINGVAGVNELSDSQEFHDEIVQRLEENADTIFACADEEHAKSANCHMFYSLPHEAITIRMERHKSTPSFDISLRIGYQESVEKDLESPPPTAREVTERVIDPSPFGPFFRSTGTSELWVVKSDLNNLKSDMIHAGLSFPDSFYLVVTQLWNVASVTKTKASANGFFCVTINGREPRNISVSVRVNPARNTVTVRFYVGLYQSVRTSDLPGNTEEEEYE